MRPSLFPDRSFRIAALSVALLAIICTRIPLFNYLGFEFSALMTIPLGLASGLLFIAWWGKRPPLDSRSFWKLTGSSFLAMAALSLVPFAVLLANALVVRNCSLTDGVILYLLIVPGASLFSLGLAAVTAASFERWQRTLFAVAFAGVLLYILYGTLARPQIFAFNPILGYFPGLTYDESLHITGRLLSYRLVTSAGAVFLLAAAAALRRWKLRRRAEADTHGPRAVTWRADLFLMAALGPMLVVVYAMSDRIGYGSSEEFIRERLSGRVLTAHIELVYPSAAIPIDRARQLADLHEYYYGVISRRLQIQHPPDVTSFLYSSPEQKARLVGAAHTDFAKPWLAQLHINAKDVPFVLKHEMVHVLAKEFGLPWLGISWTPGLIEGTAVAIEGRAYEEPLDRAAALVLAAGVKPNLEALFTVTGFISSTASVGYTFAGSFCGYLLDHYGAGLFTHLYHSADFTGTYGKSLGELEHEWRATLDTVHLSGGDSLKAAYIFRRPSIFGKECARVIADLSTGTSKLLEAEAYSQALASAERSLALSRQPDAVFQKARALFELQQYREAITFSESMLRDSALAPSLLPLRLRLGDSYWAEGELNSARIQFRLLLETHLSIYYDEACALRLIALESGPAQGPLWAVLTRSMPDTVRMARLAAINHPVAKYILGQLALANENYTGSLRWLVASGRMPSPALEYLRLRRMGRNWFELQDYQRARSFFEAARPFARSGQRLEIDEWIDRCDWSAARPHG